MAVLPDAKRAEIWANIQRELSNMREPCACSKPDLRAAIDAIDAYLEANAATMNSAIPQPARGELTAKQKAILLSYVALTRYKVI